MFNSSLLIADQFKRSRSGLPKPQRETEGTTLWKKAGRHLFSYAARCVAHQAANSERFISDNSGNSFTDRYSTNRVSQASEEASSPIVRFRTDDGAYWGFNFHHPRRGHLT
jgi:hypothetical protein